MSITTTYADRKILAAALDRCAARADQIDREPASAKQCWYLAGLILAAGEDGSEYFTNTSLVLTKGQVSRLIDLYLTINSAGA